MTHRSSVPEGHQLDPCQSDILPQAVLLAGVVREQGPGGPGTPLAPLLLQPVGRPAVLQLVVVLLGLSRCLGSLGLSLHTVAVLSEGVDDIFNKG